MIHPFPTTKNAHTHHRPSHTHTHNAPPESSWPSIPSHPTSHLPTPSSTTATCHIASPMSMPIKSRYALVYRQSLDKLPQCEVELRITRVAKVSGVRVRMTCASRVRTVSMPGTCQISTATFRCSRWANSSTCPLTPCLKQQDKSVKTNE